MPTAAARRQHTPLRIDVSSSDPLLVIGETTFALHAPLPAAGSLASTSTKTSDVASTSTAPHELYKLSEDESTLHRIGSIATKFTVRQHEMSLQ